MENNSFKENLQVRVTCSWKQRWAELLTITLRWKLAEVIIIVFLCREFWKTTLLHILMKTVWGASEPTKKLSSDSRNPVETRKEKDPGSLPSFLWVHLAWNFQVDFGGHGGRPSSFLFLWKFLVVMGRKREVRQFLVPTTLSFHQKVRK